MSWAKTYFFNFTSSLRDSVMQTKNNNISFVFIKTKRVTNYAHDLTEFRSFVRGFWPFISMHAYYMIISRVST